LCFYRLCNEVVCCCECVYTINTCLCVSRMYLILNSRGTSQYLHNVTMSIAGPEPEKDNLPLIIGLSVGIVGFLVILLIILLSCCCCKGWPLYGKCCNKRKFFIHSSLINTCILGMCGIYFFLFWFGFEKKLGFGSE